MLRHLFPLLCWVAGNARVGAFWGRVFVFLFLILLGTMPAVYAAAYSGGTGIDGDPYLISTVQDLLDLSNPANSADWSRHFLMTNDINMDGVTGFTPIAPDTDPNTSGFQE